MSTIFHQKKLFLAPLEAVSDYGFRKLCCDLGASMSWTEMLRGMSIAKKNKASLNLLDCYDSPNNTPTGIQLSVKTSQELLSCLHTIKEISSSNDDSSWHHLRNIRDIQLNFGCPSKVVIQEGGGPALLKRKSRLLDILQTLTTWRDENRRNQHSPLSKLVSVGCKIRLGLNQHEVTSKVYMNIVEASHIAGLDYIVVHARHAAQRSSELPDWMKIREIKDASSIPIIGNGSIFTRADIMHMYDVTNCDGIMISRGAMRNPWIFKSSTNNYASVEEDMWPSLEELVTAERNYFDDIKRYPPKNDKCRAFHTLNFARIRKCIETKDFQSPLLNPSKIYL